MAIMTVPDGISLAYNGYSFGPFVKTKVTEEPQWSGDGRVIKYSKITIEVSGWITQADADFFSFEQSSEEDEDFPLGETLDAFMLSLRRILQVAGKNLQYVNKGYGLDLDINGDSTDVNGDPKGVIYDVAMGPKPGKFTWWPLGGAPDGCHGAGFSWEISTCIPECGSFPTNPGANVFMEISYTVNYDCDEAGLVTIATRGNAQIPLSLRGGSSLVRSIDDSIGAIIKPPPDGFLRKVSRQLSADRASCQFTITDQQLEVPFPNDVVHMDMKQTVRQKARYSSLWICSISGTVRLSPTVNKGLAWTRFFNIVAYRMALAREQIAGFRLNNPTKKASVLPGTVEMEENLFKNESRFTVNFDILGAPFASIVAMSALWRPIVAATGVNLDAAPGFRYVPWTAATWSGSLQTNGSQLTKGLVGATFGTRGDIILNICDAADTPTGGGGTSEGGDWDVGPGGSSAGGDWGAGDGGMGAGGSSAGGDWGSVDAVVGAMEADEDEADEDADMSILGVEDGEDSETPLIVPSGEVDSRFEPDSTWMVWQCDVARITDHNVIRHKPLSGDVTYDPPPTDPLGDAEDMASDTSDPVAGWSAVPDIIQQACSPSMVLRLSGFGVRVAYRVNAPKLISYGGVTPVLLHESISETTMGKQDAIIYRTAWTLDYLIPAAPQTIPILADPLLDVDGEDTGEGAPGGLTLVP